MSTIIFIFLWILDLLILIQMYFFWYKTILHSVLYFESYPNPAHKKQNITETELRRQKITPILSRGSGLFGFG